MLGRPTASWLLDQRMSEFLQTSLIPKIKLENSYRIAFLARFEIIPGADWLRVAKVTAASAAFYYFGTDQW